MTFMISSEHLFSRVQAGSSWCGPFIYLYCLYEAMVTATSMIGSMTGLMIGIAPYENSMIGSKADEDDDSEGPWGAPGAPPGPPPALLNINLIRKPTGQ